jgi:hypothetical protein
MLCLPHHAISTHSKQGRKLHVVQAWVSPTEEIIKSNIDAFVATQGNCHGGWGLIARNWKG